MSTYSKDSYNCSIERLINIMAKLRSPDGCPWDREQNFSTIAPYTIEEAYEVADAIDRSNMSDLRDELGDLLLQVIFHSRIAEEQNEFDFYDVVEAICDKMQLRHPHVFAKNKDIKTVNAVRDMWERIKSEENGNAGDFSILDGVPSNLPAFIRAIKLQKKAAKVGFDWPNANAVIAKLDEELGELKEECLEINRLDKAKIEEELGDLLFVCANFARHMDIDPESCLRKANLKFTRRFNWIEGQLEEMGKKPETSNLKEMEALWNEAKLHND